MKKVKKGKSKLNIVYMDEFMKKMIYDKLNG